MANIPENLKYTRSHEWLEVDEDGTARVGISDHAQELLGDLVYVELPDPGRSFEANEECAVVESVKAASDVYMPVAGEIIEVNEALNDTPELINQDPYGEGWLFTIKIADADSVEALLSAAEYSAVAAEDEQ